MIAPSILLAGMGSPFGDDQAGWLLAGGIESRRMPNVTVVRLRSPDQLLDRLAGVARLIVCDACQGAGPVGSWHRWQWPSARLTELRFGGTHDLGLVAVLALADRLDQLPPEVTIWAIEGARANAVCVPGDEPTAEVQKALPQVAALIAAELNHA